MNLDSRAAARLLCVTEEKIYEWVRDGVLPSFRIQEQLRFNRVELLEWASSRHMKVAPELFEDERGGAGNGFRLSRALEVSGIHRDLPGADVRAALRAVAGVLALPPGVDRESVQALFAAREALTPVGEGIAIPHARAPVVLPVREPLVTLGFLAHPIQTKTPDGRPISALFAAFSPTIRVHLDVLSKIAFALADEALRGLIARRATDAEILERCRAISATLPARQSGAAAGGGATG